VTFFSSQLGAEHEPEELIIAPSLSLARPVPSGLVV